MGLLVTISAAGFSAAEVRPPSVVSPLLRSVMFDWLVGQIMKDESKLTSFLFLSFCLWEKSCSCISYCLVLLLSLVTLA